MTHHIIYIPFYEFFHVPQDFLMNKMTVGKCSIQMGFLPKTCVLVDVLWSHHNFLKWFYKVDILGRFFFSICFVSSFTVDNFFLQYWHLFIFLTFLTVLLGSLNFWSAEVPWLIMNLLERHRNYNWGLVTSTKAKTTMEHWISLN